MSILTIEKQINIAAPVNEVFEAISDPERIVQYYPLTSVTSSREVAGSIVCKGEIDGIAFTDYGIIEVFDRPRRVKYNYWSDNHGTLDTPENRMSIDYQLRSNGSETILALTHANLLSADRQTMMSLVWDFLLARLKHHVETL